MALSKIDSDGIVSGGITADSLNVGQIGGRRNIIINGAMQVAQRGTSSTSSGYLLDRWKLETANTDQFAFTMSQSTTAPSGFSNSLKIDTTTAETTLDTDEYIRLLQRIEAQDLQQLGFGTADAKSVTLSFWARSNLTTAFAVALYAEDNGRIIGSTFTPSVANTWEQFSITFAGDTSGTINNDNGSGLSLEIYLAAGSLWTGTDNTSWGAFANGKLANGIVSNIGSSTSNDFYITGVQLEVGSVSTPYEHRSFGEELALCQRYFQFVRNHYVFGGYQNGTSEIRVSIPLTTALRAAPSLEYSISNIQVTQPSSYDFNPYTITSISSHSFVDGDTSSPVAFAISGRTGTDDNACFVWPGGTLELDSEL